MNEVGRVKHPACCLVRGRRLGVVILAVLSHPSAADSSGPLRHSLKETPVSQGTPASIPSRVSPLLAWGSEMPPPMPQAPFSPQCGLPLPAPTSHPQPGGGFQCFPHSTPFTDHQQSSPSSHQNWGPLGSTDARPPNPRAKQSHIKVNAGKEEDIEWGGMAPSLHREARRSRRKWREWACRPSKT